MPSDAVDKYVMEANISYRNDDKSKLLHYELLLRKIASFKYKRIEDAIRKAIDILPGDKF